MGTEQFIDYLCDIPVNRRNLIKHNSESCPIEARYGGDEQYEASRKLNAGTDVVSEELWDSKEEHDRDGL